MENVYEDQTVDLKAAEFAKEQSQQNAANIMANLKGAAGGSGVAGLAQVLANQGAKQAQQAAADIGRQEQGNQARARAEAGRLQQLDVEGEQQRDLLERKGAQEVEQFDLDKQDKMLEIAGQRQAAAAQAMDNEAAQWDQFAMGAAKTIIGGVSDVRLKENINKIRKYKTMLDKIGTIISKTILTGVTYHLVNFLDRLHSVNRLSAYDLVIAIIILVACLVIWSLIEE